MTKKQTQQHIRDILATLTDITGYDSDNKKHYSAFNYAVDSLMQLVEDEIEATAEAVARHIP